MTSSYPPGLRGMAQEIATLRAQLAAVTAERDQALSSVDAWVYCHDSWQQQMSALDLAARHLLAHQHARRMEEREALADLYRSHKAMVGPGSFQDLHARVESALGGGR